MSIHREKKDISKHLSRAFLNAISQQTAFQSFNTTFKAGGLLNRLITEGVCLPIGFNFSKNRGMATSFVPWFQTRNFDESNSGYWNNDSDNFIAPYSGKVYRVSRILVQNRS